METRLIDFKATHKNVISLLDKVMLPMNYNAVYEQCGVVFSDRQASKNTSHPREKFRQHYAEGHRHPVTLIGSKNNPDGVLVLDYWFICKDQLKMFGPGPFKLCDCIPTEIAYNAGFEHGKRDDHLFRHADARRGYDRQRKGFIVEFVIADYFGKSYGELFYPPSNYKKYTESSSEDFFLDIPPFGKTGVDVKSFIKIEGKDIASTRTPKDNILYLGGEWNSDNSVTMRGFAWGKWIAQIADRWNNELYSVGPEHLWSIHALIVYLNMVRLRIGDRYITYAKRLTELGRAAA